jgi:hypothetical protein
VNDAAFDVVAGGARRAEDRTPELELLVSGQVLQWHPHDDATLRRHLFVAGEDAAVGGQLEKEGLAALHPHIELELTFEGNAPDPTPVVAAMEKLAHEELEGSQREVFGDEIVDAQSGELLAKREEVAVVETDPDGGAVPDEPGHLHRARAGADDQIARAFELAHHFGLGAADPVHPQPLQDGLDAVQLTVVYEQNRRRRHPRRFGRPGRRLDAARARKSVWRRPPRPARRVSTERPSRARRFAKPGASASDQIPSIPACARASRAAVRASRP